MEAELQPNDKDLDDDILVNSLMCLSLVGHLPSIQSLELSNLSNSIQLAINSIISNRRPNFSKYFKNLQCSIYFISNVLALNSFVKVKNDNLLLKYLLMPIMTGNYHENGTRYRISCQFGKFCILYILFYELDGIRFNCGVLIWF